MPTPYPEYWPESSWVALLLLAVGFLYLLHINRLLSSTPVEVEKLASRRWTHQQIRQVYRRLDEQPLDVKSCASKLPPKLERRYIVTGGSGLVGGYIVLQLVARGQAPESIRIVDFQKPHRPDMLTGPAADVGFVRADISSAASTDAAFSAPWHATVASLPLTVFHTAAVIVPSDRSKLVYGFCDSVNVRGTGHVLSAAKVAGADIFVATSSASISIRPVEFWVPPWRLGCWPRHYFQVLDEADFFKPSRRHEEFFSNYPASKAVAERKVCAENSPHFRTGCIRPANGIYGNPTDNTVGGPLNMQTYPSWTGHIVQSFVHGLNCAVAHLQFEAVLARPDSASAPQAGRPFTVTDPNPPVTYGDLYLLLRTLTVTPFRIIWLPPLPMLLLSYIIEAYSLLRVRFPVTQYILPEISGDIKHLKPALFSITTHLVANNAAASRPVDEGGIGYRGILSTLEGMCQEVLDWNREHLESNGNGKVYSSSVRLAEEIQKLGPLATTIQT
ncbi:NAD(P)-binding protein [Pleurostoma richardsiae]|uniref:NAD(P)-binding protein n=1 Tax=Pleurostoma richardsiae TaxID=41990 RepID=A0AA38R188_9PEZI|nr:NAD(P)-binding protein [Pleurostoma richardsiae]